MTTENPVVIVFDTETTTKDEGREIIQAAWFSVYLDSSGDGSKMYLSKNNVIENVFNEYFKPIGSISMGAMATHHIMDEDLVNCRPSEEFKLPENINYMIGHKIDFDWEAAGSPEHIKRIDTLPIAKKLWPESDSHSLGALMYFLDRENARENLTKAHSAEVDVKLCAKLTAKILDKVPNVKSFDDLWELSEYCRIPSEMPFGKHEGVAFKDIPDDYKKWLLRQDDVDPYLRKALDGEVAAKTKLLDGVLIKNKEAKASAAPKI